MHTWAGAMKSEADNAKIDLWVRQLTLMAVLLVALGLIAIGVVLYAPRAHSGPGDSHARSSLVQANSMDCAGGEDPWKREYVYILESGKPVIISYGRDGVPGGEGPDADISSRDADQSGEETK